MFSDDIAWAKHNIKREGFLFYYISDKSISSSEDIILMSLCKHNIIANSTFSWWGAWLNTNVDKIVISPKKWFKTNGDEDNKKNENLIPEQWIRL